MLFLRSLLFFQPKKNVGSVKLYLFLDSEYRGCDVFFFFFFFLVFVVFFFFFFFNFCFLFFCFKFFFFFVSTKKAIIASLMEKCNS